ncbi:hypothetical protein AbraIFM66951_001858 [Aspergillus brasiliensis]|uniref:Major facilitator superfamily (MFS) profile domain-containing protein n=1 Tax=Aspergillus brasiliensis TaxID=319629 RepID=A0A9W5YK11_9EURO|nr:hypothetical protein AbraCBS73388_002655 [Aspergillus brasiliensis]GKZ42466.1 hypothetical protein AbraIFM66951_001858 [Aspergillus brasiliensis]
MTFASDQPEIPSETTSLLAGHNESPVQPKSVARRAQQVLFLACLIAVTVDFGNYISVAPQLQIYELNICQRLHPELFDGDPSRGLPSVAPSACKAADVQGELALLRGWMSTFDQLPGIILALPYGLMADRVGRKPVLFLSLAGSIIEEIGIRVIEIVAVPLSAWLMSWNAWVPWMLGLACEIGSLSAILWLPETKPEPSVHSVNEVESVTTGPVKRPSALTWASVVHFVRSQVAQLHGFICEHPSVLVISLAFFFSSYGIEAVPFMLQYVSKRFSWSVAEV